MRRKAAALSLILFAIIAVGEVRGEGGDLDGGRACFQAALKEGTSYLKAAKLKECALLLEKTCSGEISTKERCYFLLGRTYEKLYEATGSDEFIEKSVGYYRKVAGTKGTSLADDAQFAIGFLYKNTNLRKARDEFAKVVAEFPQGDKASKAKVEVDEIDAYLSKNSPNPPESFREVHYLKEISYAREGEHEKIIIYPNEKLRYKIDRRTVKVSRMDVQRLTLTFERCVLSPRIDQKGLSEKSSLIKRLDIRSDYDKGGSFVKLSLDIPSDVKYKTRENTNPFHLILEVFPVSSTPGKAVKDTQKVPPLDSYQDTKVGDVVRDNNKKGIRTIVLDPGHGGRDKGALGIGNIHEKDLTLKITKELKNILEREGPYKVLLTRSGDTYLSLAERVKIANNAGADFFVSIHLNGHTSPSVRGIETYFLNVSRDKESARVAAVENAVLNKKMSDLEAILQDLLQASAIAESAQLARSVHNKIVEAFQVKGTNIKDLGVKSAPFYVLFGVKMPGILLEAGFITNKEDIEIIQTPTFSQLLADGIIRGIESYGVALKR